MKSPGSFGRPLLLLGAGLIGTAAVTVLVFLILIDRLNH